MAEEGLATVRVAVVARTAVVGRYVRDVLETTGGLTVVADVPGYPGAVEQVFAFDPQVLVVEVSAADPEAVQVTRLAAIRAQARPMAVLLLADAEDQELVQALHGGARGVLIGAAGRLLLPEAVRLAVGGYCLVPRSLRAEAVASTERQWLASQCDAAVLGRLTPRELDIVRLVACGYSNAEISTALRLSDSTVKSYLRRIFEKAGVRNRVGLVAIAYRAGLLPPNGP